MRPYVTSTPRAHRETLAKRLVPQDAPPSPQTLKTCLRPKAFPERATGAWRVPGPQLSSENPSMPSEGKPLCTWSQKSSTLTPVWSTICLDSKVYQVPKDIFSRRITACPSSCSKVWVHCSLLPFAVVLHPPEKLPERDPWVLEMTSVNSFKTQSSQQTKRPTQGFGLHEQEAGRSDVNHPYTSSGRRTNGNKCHFGRLETSVVQTVGGSELWCSSTTG